MKKSFNSLFAQLNNSSLENLTKEVKETIAFSLTKPNSRSFTAADLWNIQRHTKSRVKRRFL